MSFSEKSPALQFLRRTLNSKDFAHFQLLCAAELLAGQLSTTPLAPIVPGENGKAMITSLYCAGITTWQQVAEKTPQEMIDIIGETSLPRIITQLAELGLTLKMA